MPTTSPSAEEPPPAPREFRGVWVATVGNIDWPAKPAESTEQQQKEAIAILDRCVDLNINAVIFQVRPAADAMYASSIEPWSYYLTGEQGKAPSPFYDPLKFWIEQAHARGIELHAWFNPFRANVNAAVKNFAPNHVSQTHPSIVRDYREYLWLDPGEPAAREQTFRVFMDVAKRYDVDGLHIDDYFYPYRVKLNPSDPTDKRELPFPDDDSYARYQSGGGKLSLDDWRRDNINVTIKHIYDGLKKDYPQVRFGISPFGIGHNRPAVVKGFDPYEQIYCDSELWLKNGWCDYLTPQLYWKIEAPQQPFETLLKFWVSENDKHRNIYAGLFTGKATASAGEDEPTTATSQPRRRGTNAWPIDEIVRQVEIAHDTPGAGGTAHFSMKSLMNEEANGVAAALKAGPYKEPALPPASPWLNNNHPNKPHVNIHPSGDGAHVTWSASWGERPWLWAVWVKQGGEWKFHVYPAAVHGADFEDATAVCVSAVDRTGNESPRVILSVH